MNFVAWDGDDGRNQIAAYLGTFTITLSPWIVTSSDAGVEGDVEFLPFPLPPKGPVLILRFLTSVDGVFDPDGAYTG